MKIAGLKVYPIKSCRGAAVREARVEARGLAGDRRYMIIDENDCFLTGRQSPRMVLIAPQLDGERLTLTGAGMPSLDVWRPAADAPLREVTVWKDTVMAQDAGSDASCWLSEFLGREVRLAYQPDASVRSIADAVGGKPGEQTSFADGYPLLAIGSASLDALNAELTRPVTMDHFRPNIIIATTQAYAEDAWPAVRIGDVSLRAAKPCTRCVFTSVDPVSGQRADDGEPLATLRRLRFSRAHRGVLFGMNWVPEADGILTYGMNVQPVV